jgi:large subunit ribosomal protein L25
MAQISITATTRTEFGKGASRRDRRAGLVPGVIYGHGAEPQHVALPLRELTAALKQSNVLLELSFEGKTELVLPKSVSRNPLTGIFAHIDLIAVRKGEKVTVEVPVHTSGEHDRDGILEHNHNTISVLAEATSIPSFLTLDLTGLMAGQSLFAKDVVLPAGTELASDPMMQVVHLSERGTSATDDAAAPAADATPAAPAAE